MALTTRDRTAIHAGLVKIMDDEHAEAFLAAHPSNDHDELATRGHLHGEIGPLRGELVAGLAEATTERARILAELRGGLAEADADRERIRVDLAGGFAEAAADRERIRVDLAGGFAEAAADRDRIRVELRTDIARLHAALAEQGASLRKETGELATGLRAEMAELRQEQAVRHEAFEGKLVFTQETLRKEIAEAARSTMVVTCTALVGGMAASAGIAAGVGAWIVG